MTHNSLSSPLSLHRRGGVGNERDACGQQPCVSFRDEQQQQRRRQAAAYRDVTPAACSPSDVNPLRTPSTASLCLRSAN
ncbi:hypothetical protein INR49_024790 [Caranx melampygus]|nr:hypothetical protein INR49_024790 [Caranx melampygus]